MEGSAHLRRLWIFAALAAVFLLSGCAEQSAETTFFAMDTVMSVRVWGRDAQDACDAVQEQVTALERELSVTDSDSALAQLNASGSGALPEDALTLLRGALDLSARTGGALDPTLYPAVRLWGFTTGDYRVPADDEIADALSRVGAEHVAIDSDTVTLSDGAMLDFGAVAKGYAAQKCADFLSDDVTAALLSFGGNVQTIGDKPDGTAWHIGVQDPFGDGTAAALTLTGTNAVVTSGGYQRYFEENGVRYCHILDPETGAPADSGLSSVTIVAKDGLLADGLSTALFVMGLDDAAEFWRDSDDFEAVFITDDGAIYYTAGLSGCIEADSAEVIAR